MIKDLSKLSDKFYLALWLLMIGICCLLLTVKLSNNEQSYDAGLLAALEIDSAKHQAAIALGKNYQNKVLMLVGHKSLAQAADMASEIRAQLKTKPWLSSIYSNPLNSDQLQALISYYGDSPYSYLASKQKDELIQALDSNQTQAITDNYFALLDQWADPIVSQSLTSDATLTLANYLKERLLTTPKDTANWQFKQQEFMLAGADINYIPIFITLKPSYANIRDSAIVYQDLQAVKAKYSSSGIQESSDSALLMTGMILHSASASLQAQAEISSFGVLSLIGVIIIIVFAFRAVMPLLACLLVIASALLVGITALLLSFSSIHLLALVFAVSILGIAVDYGFHVLVLRQHSQGSAHDTRKKVVVPLTIALMSTIAGYSLFFTTPINLLHQVVVFVGFGLLGAYLSALLLLPCIKVNHSGTPFAARLPKQNFSYLVIASIVFIVTIPQLNFNDNIANLNTSSPSLIQEEQQVADLTGENIYPYMVLVSGETADNLLKNTLQLSKQLRSQGAELKTISDWQLPKIEQQQNTDLFKANWRANNYQTIESYLDKDAVESKLATAKPLALMPSSLRDNIGLDIKEVSNQYWTALLLSAPLSTEQRESVNESEYTDYVNLPQALSTQLSEVRIHVLQLVVPAMLVILIILSLYFGLTSAIIMLLVPTVSAGLALLTSQFFQTSLNIFNLLACLLIITLAIDYVVFLRAHGVTKTISHTIGLSALSSAITFGVMTYSTTPAVSSFGLTLLIGISFAWLLSHLTPLTKIKNKNGNT